MSAEAEKKDAFDLAIEHMWKQYRKDFDVPAAGYRIEDFSAGYEAGFSAGREHERKKYELMLTPCTCMGWYSVKDSGFKRCERCAALSAYEKERLV